MARPSRLIEPTFPSLDIVEPPKDPYAEDLRTIAEALTADPLVPAGLAAIEAGRAALARLGDKLTRELDRSKRAIAAMRAGVRVLVSRQYSAPGCGLFKPPVGKIYLRSDQPRHLNAIVTTGKVGVDFEFVSEA